MPGLHFDITADNKVFVRSVEEVGRSVRDATEQIESDGGDIEAVFTRIQKAASLAAAGFSLKEFVSKVASTRGEFQQLEVAFSTMLGSEEEAVALMDQLTQTAAKTPFDLQGIADGAKQLLAYGVSAKEVNGTLVRLGDIAAGLSIPLGDLVYLYGTTMAQGRLYTQDLNQFTGRGIPMISELAKQFGVAESQVKKLVEEGKVGFPEVQKVIENLTNEGGKFGGLMEAQSKTINGQISNIKDSIDSMFNEIGQSSEGIINTSLGMVSSLVENWKTVGVILGDIAVAYGVQKAILVGMAAVTSSMYKAEVSALAAVLPAKEQSVNLDVAEAVSKGRLSRASAERVIALRAEVKAQLEQLAATKASATAEAAAAAEKYRASLQQSLAAKAAVAAKREELIASGQIVGSTLSENAVKEMGIVTDKAKAASVQSAAAKQEYYAATTKKRAAVEALATATSNANTAAQTVNARSTGILTVAKAGLAKATKALYSTMMANPYALITAAVVALGYGIYKLVTYQTDAEKAQKRLDESFEKAEGAVSAENVQIGILFDRLRNAKKGTEEWQKARDAIWSKYGNYLKALGDEKTALNDVEKAYKLVAQAARDAAMARAMDNLMQQEGDNYAEKFSKSYDKIYSIISEKKGKDFADASSERISKVLSGQAKFAEDFLSQFEEVRSVTRGQLGGGGGSYAVNPLKMALEEAAKNEREYQQIIKEAEKKFGSSFGSDETTTTNNVKVTENKEYWETQKKNAQSRLDALSDIAAKGAEGDKLRKEIQGYDEKLNLYSTSKGRSSQASAQKTAIKRDNAAEKLAELLRKQAQERLQIEQDYEYERWQSRIDLMQEGEEKVLAQQELNNSKEISSLNRRKEQEISAEIERQKALFNARKEAGQTTGNFVIDQNGLDNIEARYAALQEALTKAQQKVESERLTASKESMNAYLREFGSYQQKRLAIEEEYQAKINAAENEGQRMQLTAQRDKAHSDLDYSEWVDSGSIALAFGDISKLSDKTVTRLIADMERYREKVIATFDPEKIQKYEEALSNLRKLDADNSFGIFSNMIPDFFKQRAAAQKELTDAEENYKNLLFEETKLQMQLNALKRKISTTVKQQTGRDITAGQAGDVNYLESLKSELNAGGNDTQWLSNMIGELGGVQTQLNGVSQATQGAQKSFLGLQESFTSAFGQGASTFAMIDTVVHGVNDIVQGLNGTFKELSSTAEALGADMSDGSGWSQAGIIMQGFADASQGATEAWDSLKSGNIMGVIQGVVKSFTSWIKAFAAFGDAKHEKKIQRIQEQIDALQKAYDKLGKSADDAFSTDASELIGQQNTLLKQQKALILQQMAEEEDKKNTDEEKMKQYQERLDEIDEALEENKEKAKEAIIGEDIKSAIGEFADAYASAWEEGTDAAQKSMAAVKGIITSALTELLKKNIQPAAQDFYDTLAKAMEDGILTDSELAALDAIKAQMDILAAEGEEQYEKIQERYRDLDELREELTDISFDSVRDNFKSQLLDMKSDASDFTEDFTDMLREALVEGLMDNKYDAMLKEWYNEFAEAMRDQSLTDEERDQLRQQYEDIVNQGIADRDAVNDILGGGAYSQSATAGGWGSMGQDSAEELNGRFTALTELYAIGNEQRAENNRIAWEILATLRTFGVMPESGQNGTLLDIKDMIFISTGHLENIEKYTKILSSIDLRIERLNDLVDKKL